jgi:hypothetical protein
LQLKAERRDGQVTSSVVTFTKLREEPDAYPTPVEFTVTPAAIVVVGATSVDARPLEERVLERLSIGLQTKRSLRSALGCGEPAIEEALSALFAARRIVTADTSVRGIPRKAFALRVGA